MTEYNLIVAYLLFIIFSCIGMFILFWILMGLSRCFQWAWKFVNDGEYDENNLLFEFIENKFECIDDFPTFDGTFTNFIILWSLSPIVFCISYYYYAIPIIIGTVIGGLFLARKIRRFAKFCKKRFNNKKNHLTSDD